LWSRIYEIKEKGLLAPAESFIKNKLHDAFWPDNIGVITRTMRLLWHESAMGKKGKAHSIRLCTFGFHKI
jgi:hypothetical protein